MQFYKSIEQDFDEESFVTRPKINHNYTCNFLLFSNILSAMEKRWTIDALIVKYFVRTYQYV